MHRQEKEISDRSAIDEIILDCDVVRLALARENIPYLIPLNFGYDGRHLYIHTARRGRKIDFIEANPQVCFEFERRVQVLQNDTRACKWSCAFESVIGSGVIFELRDFEKKIHGLSQIMQHYDRRAWTFDKAVVEKTRIWRIQIQGLCGKRSKH